MERDIGLIHAESNGTYGSPRVHATPRRPAAGSAGSGRDVDAAFLELFTPTRCAGRGRRPRFIQESPGQKTRDRSREDAFPLVVECERHDSPSRYERKEVDGQLGRADAPALLGAVLVGGLSADLLILLSAGLPAARRFFTRHGAAVTRAFGVIVVAFGATSIGDASRGVASRI
jgi:hypothetical protein